MDTIPTEILLEIGKTDLETYVGMLAIPRFARAVTVGYRLDMLVREYAIGQLLYIMTNNFVITHTIRRTGTHEYIRQCIHRQKGHIVIDDRNVNVSYCTIMTTTHYNQHFNDGTVYYRFCPGRISAVAPNGLVRFHPDY